MQTWQLQQAKAKLSEVIDIAKQKGPQMITRRGVETAVLVPVEEWRRLQSSPQQTMLQLLQSGPRFEIPLPKRGRLRMRKPIAL